MYLYSDGFQDQFGEPSGKKYCKKRMKEFIGQQVVVPINRQEQVFDAEFENWKQEMDQVNDAVVCGFELR